MTAAEQQKTLAIEGSYLPTRKELYEDPEVIDALPAVRLGKEAVLNTTTPPVSPYYSDMSLAMSDQFNANILGDVRPEEAAATLKSELESIIAVGARRQNPEAADIELARSPRVASTSSAGARSAQVTSGMSSAGRPPLRRVTLHATAA